MGETTSINEEASTSASTLNSNSDSVGRLEAALDLLRRLPPQNIKENISRLASLLPEQAASLPLMVDVPATTHVCPQTGREYLRCDHNRDGNSWRSPWSNEYDPSGEGVATAALRPSERLRRLELIANEAFDTYRSLYYEGGVSSVYFWDVPSSDTNVNDDADNHRETAKDNDPSQDWRFGAAVLIKKEAEGDDGPLRGGAWDAIHIIEGGVFPSTSSLKLKLTTSIILHLDTAHAVLDSFLLSGSITRQSDHHFTFSSASSAAAAREQEIIVFMGRIVEEMESRMRGSLQEIYFGKTHDVINEIRPVLPAGFLRHQADLQREMADRLRAPASFLRKSVKSDDEQIKSEDNQPPTHPTDQPSTLEQIVS